MRRSAGRGIRRSQRLRSSPTLRNSTMPIGSRSRRSHTSPTIPSSQTDHGDLRRLRHQLPTPPGADCVSTVRTAAAASRGGRVGKTPIADAQVPRGPAALESRDGRPRGRRKMSVMGGARSRRQLQFSALSSEPDPARHGPHRVRRPAVQGSHTRSRTPSPRSR